MVDIILVLELLNYGLNALQRGDPELNINILYSVVVAKQILSEDVHNVFPICVDVHESCFVLLHELNNAYPEERLMSLREHPNYLNE